MSKQNMSEQKPSCGALEELYKLNSKLGNAERNPVRNHRE